MRFLTALGLVAVAATLAEASHVEIEDNPAFWTAPVLYGWLGIGGLALIGLCWLYTQIAIGPRATVGEKTIARLERRLGEVRARKGFFRKRRERRLAAEASQLAARIDPPSEARNVRGRRNRLTNAVVAFVAILSMAFWMLASLAPRIWPDSPWFADSQPPPDPVTAALFSIDQVTRGTIFDLVDVYDLKFTSLRNDPHNVWFSSVVMIYRLFVGAALIAAIAVRLGMREDWRDKVAREAAENTKARLARLASG
jgi:hypothetical protein